jgi:hypothetical protein
MINSQWLRTLGQGQLAFLHGCRGELQGGQEIGPARMRTRSRF